jgi:hypothetical protein
LARFFVVRSAVSESRISWVASAPRGMASWNSFSILRIWSAREFCATPPFSRRVARADAAFG